MNKILNGQLRFMNQFFEVVGVSSFVEKDVKEISEREGIRMSCVEMARNISLLKDLKALWQLYLLFRKEKPAIVHSHTPKAGLLAMLAACFAGVRVRLHTVAGMPLLEKKGLQLRLLEFIERLTYRCAHRIYPNSKGLYDIIRTRQYCKKEKLQVIANGSSNGIDTTFFNPEYAGDSESVRNAVRKNLNISDSDFVFCFVGRLSSDKGIVELVEAMEAISSEVQCKLLLIGPIENQTGVLAPGILEKIQTHPSIIYPGRADDVRPFLLASEAFVFPSYREGFPNAVLQAAAMGLPCLVSNINGCNEIITQGENGLIFEPKNSKSLVAAMRYLLDNLDERQYMKSMSRKKILERYQQFLVWDQLKMEYTSFIAERVDTE